LLLSRPMHRNVFLLTPDFLQTWGVGCTGELQASCEAATPETTPRSSNDALARSRSLPGAAKPEEKRVNFYSVVAGLEEPVAVNLSLEAPLGLPALARGARPRAQ
jgi:hypothetical protein